MHMQIVLACPTLTPTSHRMPGSAKSAKSSVGDCHQQGSKSRCPWYGAPFQCKGSYRYFEVGVETKERPRRKSLFPENATVVATTAQGGSRKKCFSNAIGCTLVVLEVL